MDNRKKLLEVVQKSNKKTNDIIFTYLYKKYESHRASTICDEVLNGKLDKLEDEEIIGILGDLGYEATEEANEETEFDDIEHGAYKEEIQNITKLYNSSVMENESLRKENLKKDTQIESLRVQIQEINNKFSKLFDLTGTSTVNIIPDEDINNLFVEYKMNGTKELGKASIIEVNDNPIIIKSYYDIKK